MIPGNAVWIQKNMEEGPMRKIYALIMTMALILCMGSAAVYAVPAAEKGAGETTHAAEAAATQNTAGSQSGPQVSEWVIAENEAAALPEDVKAAFDKAKAGFNGEIVPVAYFARQLVTGGNFQVLCRVTAVPEKAAGDAAAAGTTDAAAKTGDAGTTDAAAKTGDAGKTDAAAKKSDSGTQTTEGSKGAAEDAKPVTSYKVAVISMDLLGKVKIERMSDFNIADYTGLTAEEEGAADGTTEGAADAAAGTGGKSADAKAGDAGSKDTGSKETGSKDAKAGEEKKTPVTVEPADPNEEIPAELLGGWSVPADYTKIALPEEVKAAFDKGAEQFFGNELEPMAYLGKQTAEGTNYAVLCHSLLTTAEAVESIQVVMIYQDTDGNAYITSANTVDPVSFVKAETQVEDGGAAAAAGAETPEKSSN